MTMPPSVRGARLAEAQNWRCAYCGFPMLAGPDREEERSLLGGAPGRQRARAAQARRLTKDHLALRCDSGSDGFENLAAACRCCNEFRGDRSALDAFRIIARMIRRGTHPHQVWHRTGRWLRLTPMRRQVEVAA